MGNKKSINALEKFIQNIFLGDNLSETEAIKNLESGLLEIKHNDTHASNALLITNNGYALTANHCTHNHQKKQY